jgi:hypothetical protein
MAATTSIMKRASAVALERRAGTLGFDRRSSDAKMALKTERHCDDE